MNLFERWNAELDALRKKHPKHTQHTPSGIDFTSNDYLGYASIDASHGTTPDLSRSGAASRLLRGHHQLWDQVETQLAAWHGSETTLVMNSGYAANEGLLSTILEPGDWVATDELNHACIVDGLRLARCRRFSYKHNDLDRLADGLKAEAAKNEPSRERFIITESLFSMDGDRPDLRSVADLAERYDAKLIVDEAHSTGCFGTHGSGCVDEAGIRNRVLVSVHTGGKALGVVGAYVACSRLLKDYLINKCRHLIFTTALPPICAAWWLESLQRCREDDSGRAKLHAGAARLRHSLAESGIQAWGQDYIVPVVVGDNGPAVRVSRILKERGFDVRAIRPPSVPLGTARLRISVHADHDFETLDRLAISVAEAIREVRQGGRND